MDNGRIGILFVVATPIGNLGDASPRAREILGSVAIIACEDTRVTGKLLARWEIPRPTLLSYREENESERTPGLLAELEAGRDVALASDAGTPTISDPGFRLVRACRAAGISVRAVPGPSACVAALSVSGLPSDRFFFAGFLPPKSAARRRFLEEHRGFPSTIILYESVHRIEKLLSEVVEVLGEERVIAVSRELTKKFETSSVGPAGEVREEVLSRARKGEYVVVIAPEGFSL